MTSFLVLCLLLGLAASSHFRGGNIQWRPLDPGTNFNGDIELSHRIAWRRSSSEGGRCTQSTIDNQVLIGSGSLDCRSGCSGRVGTMTFFCTDFSESEDWTAGTRTYTYNGGVGLTYFEASFSTCCWIPLTGPGSSGDWELRVKVNLTRRADNGLINTSPVSSMPPIVRLQRGCNHTINIPVEDANGDHIRCRWASAIAGECGDVCDAFPESVLDVNECTIRYQATSGTGLYAVALQIEDFAQPTDTVPLSSIPLQFLVSVFASTESCVDRPTLVDETRVDGSCIGVPFNTTWQEPIIAQSGGDGVRIVEIITASPAGLRRSSLTQTNSSRKWFIDATWTPDISQHGPNIFCYSALDSEGLTSLQSCITLVGGVEAPQLVENSFMPVGEIFPNHTTWALRFDRQFFRPTRSRYIRFFEEDGTEVLTINAFTSPDISYPQGSLGRDLTFRTNYLFVEKETYYVLLDPGIVQGPEFCGPESPALRDRNIWVVTIADITPPTLGFTNNPLYSNENVTIRWSYDEEASSHCTLQTPTSLFGVPCNNSLTFTNLVAGVHSLFIQGTDLAGNVAATVRHTWTVDLTAPDVQLLSTPPTITNQIQWTFRFTCVNEWRCTYMCSVHVVGNSAQYSSCDRTWVANTPQNEGNYEFEVIATDGVGNIGDSVTYRWRVDTAPPAISMVNDITLPCGGDFSPASTGTPTVTDNVDLNPTVSFDDQPAALCTVRRVWSAIDEAGNSAQATQTITFTSPQPPNIVTPSNIAIPCGSVEEAIQSAAQEDLVVSHPCERPVTISFTDSATVDRCGFTFSRTWLVTDDCGSSNTFVQTIRVLDQQSPDGPENGQINTRLNEPLLWPQFPGATSYRVFVWQHGTERPTQPTSVLNTRQYRPSTNYVPGTRYLWQIEYVTGVNTSVPSPVWGFETQPFPDLAVTAIMLPAFAFSGQSFEVSWTVINQGNVSTGVSLWYDTIYIGATTDFFGSRRAINVQQNRFADPQDGYMDSATIELRNDEIGNFYVFVVTDSFRQVTDIDRSNNRRTSTAPLQVNLTPPPNLVVESIVTPSSSFSGQRISIRWTVSNDGVGVTASDAWSDRVFWSANDQLDPQDRLLGTYRHNGVLAAGVSYTTPVMVSVPERIFGNFTIIVVTDVFNEVYEHISEEDNTRSSAPPINVILSPPPDLIVSSLEVEDQYTTGSVMSISYTVRNVGAGEPSERYWRDILILTSIPPGLRYTLDRENYYGDLEPDHTYTNNVQYTVSPNIPTGRYNLTAETDYTNVVFEFNSETNNLRWQEVRILQQLPDLTVTSGTFAMQTNPQGNTLQVNFTVTNIGIGPTLSASWADRVGLSSLSSYSPQNTQFLGQLVQGIELGGNLMYTQSLSATVPRDLYGNLYIHIQTDYVNRVVETSETNNVLTIGPVSLPAVFPDLSVQQASIVQGLSEAVAGNQIEILWTAINEGNGFLAEQRWLDAVYIDTVPRLSLIAVKLASVSTSTSLQPQGVYNQSSTLTLPISFAGPYYLIVNINDNAAINENGALANNFVSIPLTLLAPPSPDLRIRGIEYSYVQTERKDRILTVYWTVVNAGNTMQSALSWTDQVFLSSAPSFSRQTAIRLGQREVTRQRLETHEMYIASTGFLLPGNIFGDYFIFVEIDSSNEVREINGENNNMRRSTQAITIDRPAAPRLRVQVISDSLPSSLTAGEVVTVQYQVSNIGDATLSATSWIDGIYLFPERNTDRNDVLDNGILLAQILNNRELPAGETYSISVNVTIPHQIANPVQCLVVIVDINANLGDPEQFSSVSKSDNQFEVEQGPLSDLAVIPPATNITLQGGQPATVTFQVENIGNTSAVGRWYEAVYLSRDAILDPFDIRLKTVSNIMNLGINESYTQTVEVFIPFDLPSSAYYFFYYIDVADHIEETNEDNNIGQQIVSILEAVSTDIAIVSVSASPPDLEYGDDVSFEWVLRNNGSLEARGYKCDTVYLSDDEVWDITDHQVGEPQCAAVTLQPYEGQQTNDRTYRLTEATPFIAQQTYTGIVRTRSNIRDPDLQNNIGFSSTPLSITAPTLLLDTPTTIQLSTGDELVYKIDNIPSEETLIATLTVSGDDETPYHDLFLRHEEPPTGFAHDAFSQNALSSNQRVVVRNTRAGTYYLRIESSSRSTQQYQVVVLVKIARFEILAVSPTRAAPLGNVTLFFSGTVFGYYLEASLTNSSGEYPATNVYWFNSEQFYATFDISSLSTGMYTPSLRDTTTGEVVQLANSFEITQGIPGQPTVQMVPPRPLRPGEIGRLTVYVSNTGNTDILTPLMKLNTGGRALVRIYDEGSNNEFASEINFLSLPITGPGGILPPGASTQTHFEVFSPNPRLRRDTVQLSIVEDSAEPHSYLNQRDNLRPSSIPEGVWDIIWDNFLESVGTTWSSFNQRMSEFASEYSLLQRKFQTVDDIVDFQLLVADGLLTGDVILELEDIADEGLDTALPLRVLRQYSSFIHKRRTPGPMGMGWLLPWWELKILQVNNTAVLLQSGRDEIEFTTTDSGVYSTSDGTTVTVNTEDVVYLDSQNQVTYTFNWQSGELMEISYAADNSSITVGYMGTVWPVLYTHSNGKKLNVTYTNSGKISYIDILDEDNNVETTSFYTYDASGEYLTRISVGNSSTTYVYNDEGDLTSVEYSSGRRMILQYQENNLLSGIESYSSSGALVAASAFTHSWNGAVQLTTQPENITQELHFDLTGEVISTRAESNLPLMEVNLPGFTGTRTIFGDKVLSEERREDTTNTVFQTDANGNRAMFRYNENGNLVTFTDSGGNEYNTEYDVDERITGFQNPDGTRTRFNYDGVGHIAGVVNPDGTETTFSYDSNDLLLLKDDGNEQTSYEYDSMRRMRRATNSQGSVTIFYYDNGAPQQVVYPNGRSLTYGYNSNGQRTFIADNSDYNVTYSYDEQYRLADITNANSDESVAHFDYNPTGRLSRKTYGNGAYTIYNYYTTTGLLYELRNYLPDGSLSSMFTYEYDKEGKLTLISTNGENSTYSYDPAGQLVKWTTPNGDVTEYRYDSRGNRIVVSRNGRQSGYSVNNMNQYTVYNETNMFLYDPNGNLREKNSVGRRERYIFDPEGKLTQTETPDIRCLYHYDALGNLYRKNCSDFTSMEYLVDPFGRFGADIIAEVFGDETTYFIHSFENGLAAAMRLNNETMLYYEFDGDGSVLSVMDEEGGILNSYQYDPFGKILQQSEQTRNIFKFVGRYGIIHDGELVNVYMMRARHYDAEHGRFISPDPIGLSGNSLNFYTYAQNNPFVGKDPTGRILPVAVVAFLATPTGRAVVGAGLSTLTYLGTSVLFGESITAGGVLGAAASGAIGSVTLTGGLLRRSVFPFAAGVAGTLIQKGVDDPSSLLNGETYVEAVSAGLINAGVGHIAEKLLGNLRGRIPAQVAAFYNAWRPLLKKFAERAGKYLQELAKSSIGKLLGNLALAGLEGLKMLLEDFLDWIRSFDPNDILGPAGYGAAHFIPPDLTLDYRIRFENDANATAPAQRVLISHRLDDDLDIRTFRVGSFGFGDFVRELSANRAFLQDTVNVTDTQGVFVRVRAGIDIVSGEATWELQALDPETGEPPVDPRVGFLPPNNDTDGQGFVTFTVRANAQVESLTRIDATARIFFDQNEPIDTPPIFNTIDRSAPTLNLTVVEALADNGTLAVQFEKTDVGSGVAEVDVYQLTGGSDALQVSPVILGSTDDVVVLPLSPGSQYSLFASAVDNVGNRRPLEEDMQNILVVDFPITQVACPNDCSGRGNCTEFGTCQCSPGFYGNDCSLDMPPVEPPVLELSSLGGVEDSPVSIQISARLADPNAASSEDGPIVQIVSFPQGSSFNRGNFNGSVWTFTPTDFGEAQLTLPENLAGNISLVANAMYSGAVRDGTIEFTVQPIADPPVISYVELLCYDTNSNRVELPLSVSLNDTDGSEMLSESIAITSIPSDAILNMGERGSDGEYTLSLQDLSNAAIQFSGEFEPFNIVISTYSVEQTNGGREYTNVSIYIDSCTALTTTSTPGINECVEGTHNCKQICIDTDDSYTCSCNDGYVLADDGVSCNVQGLSSTVVTIIAAVAGGVGFIILLVILLCICICLCVCCARSDKYKARGGENIYDNDKRSGKGLELTDIKTKL